jgi:hypothetical protein
MRKPERPAASARPATDTASTVRTATRPAVIRLNRNMLARYEDGSAADTVVVPKSSATPAGTCVSALSRVAPSCWVGPAH